MQTSPAVLIGALIWLLVAPQVSAQWGTVRGRVLDGLIPVAGAVVELQSGCVGAYSDTMGSFSFANLPIGQYRISVFSPNRHVPDALVELQNADILDVTILLRRKTCDSAAAQLDIEAGIPLLVIGPAFQANPNPQADNAFEKHYGVRYDVRRNTSPADVCIWPYNLTVIRYLDRQFGRQWRGDVRKEIRSYFVGEP
jgi:hypothetical protein